MGCLAGDAQSYILFCDFFDRIIESYHGYKVTTDIVQESDFNYDNLKVKKKKNLMTTPHLNNEIKWRPNGHVRLNFTSRDFQILTTPN